MRIIVAVVLTGLMAQLVVLVWNIVYWKLRRSPQSEEDVKVSVLIPARNERGNLPRLLQALGHQMRAPYEVVVCDDSSDDGTGEWLAAHAGEAGALWFPAEPKPDEWIGKNWACHQLGMRARGEWLLFLDADVEPAPEFIGFMGSVLAGTEATLVTAMPRWGSGGIGDGLLVGMVPFSVFTTLPLCFAERHPNPAFAFANGQVIAFPRDAYREFWPHERVRGDILEDVKLAALVKSQGMAVHIADASRVLRVRMYAHTREALSGFAKNAVEICRSVPRAITYAVVMLLLYILPIGLFIAGEPWAALPATLAALLYGTAVALVGLPWWYGILYPVAILLTELVMLRSIVWHRRSGIHWRGRVYQRP
jgi:chlorobactene glucosyltransferase